MLIQVKPYALRQTSFARGYNPLLNFSNETPTWSQITLPNQVAFSSGKEGTVQTAFFDSHRLRDDFDEGTRFHFREGGEPVGEGVISSIG